MMNKPLVPSGFKEKYKPLHRELFWDKSGNLYIYNKDHWMLIAGKMKQFWSIADNNLEIVYRPEDKERWYPAIRLIDDIDINTMELGKFSDTTPWKGTVKLGTVYNSTFFPLTVFGNGKDIIGGKFLMRITRGEKIEYGMYHVTCSAAATGSIFGSDDNNIKCTLQRIFFKDGNAYVGFRTFETETWNRVNGRNVATYTPPNSIEVWFNGWDARTKKPLQSYTLDDIRSSKVIARN